jgi:hypothetical protein
MKNIRLNSHGSSEDYARILIGGIKPYRKGRVALYIQTRAVMGLQTMELRFEDRLLHSLNQKGFNVITTTTMSDNNYLPLLGEMQHNPNVLVNYFTDQDLPQISKVLACLEDDQLLEWCKKAVPMLEGEQLQVDTAMAKIKTIVDKRVPNEAAQAGWYKFTLVPASQRCIRVAQTAFILFSTFLDLRPVLAGPDLQTLIYGWL